MKNIWLKDVPETRKDAKDVFQYYGLSYFSGIIQIKSTSRHHNDLLAVYFCINKTRKLIARKSYWWILSKDIEAYVLGCDICLAL